MSYSLSTLWHERQRYLPGVLAVAFSALLIALQCGLLLGLFSITSMPIDRGKAHVWMGAPGVLSLDLGRPIRGGYLARMAAQPEIDRCEVYMQGFAYSAQTARPLLKLLPSQITYVLGHCKDPADAARVAERLNREFGGNDGTITAFTASDFSWQSRKHWITKTKAGIALGYAAALGLL